MIENKLKADPLVSRVYNPENATEAYQDLINHQNEVLGAIFDWRN
jgi:cystathionine beta-lyase/cystathionine gamma-synthase